MSQRRWRVWGRRALSIVIVAAVAAIAFAEGQIEIAGDSHDLTMADEVTIMGSGDITRAVILSPTPVDAFALYELMIGDDCALDEQSCNYTGRDLSVNDQILGVLCDYQGGIGSAFARLRVEGENPAVDFDEEMIYCFARPTTDGAFTVTPPIINVGDVPIGTASTPPRTITVKNLLAVAYPLSISSLSAEWAVTGCGPPCTLGPFEEKLLQVTLTPLGPGPRDSMVMFSGGANGTVSATSVMLRGNGVEQVESLDVTFPAGPAFNLDMGPVPLSGGMRTMRLRYTGGGPSIPVSILTSNSTLVHVDRDAFSALPGENDVVVTCTSPMPAQVSETLTITTSAGVEQNTMTVNVLCTVTNASVTLDPAELDFGDVLKDSGPVELTLMVRNTGTTTVLLDDFAIVSATPLQTLALVTMPNGDLTPGTTALVTIRVTPTVGEDYADTTKLRFTVDDIALDVGITGRVTVKSGRIDPTRALDLGTACVGAPITGTIRLTNDGTAPIEMSRPMLTGPFIDTYSPVVPFPVEIPEGEVQSVMITTTQTSGSLVGTFTWLGDVGPYALDLRAEYIADGTAVSPRSLDFAVIDVDATTAPRTITLENCDSVPATLSVQSVVPRQGPARAWLIEPGMETTTLDPGERYTVTVRFAPVTPGQHLAELPFVVDGVQTTVMLSGFADGELLERTSFYACTCSGGGSVAGGWPLLGALGLLVRRRRRRVRAARARSATSR
jgi:hypothetical protein